MPALDKLIERLQSGCDLVLEAEREPVMNTPGGKHVLMRQALSCEQVEALLVGIAPATARESIRQRKATRFTYSLGGRAVRVDFTAEGDAIKTVIAFEDDGRPASPRRSMRPKMPAPRVSRRPPPPAPPPARGASLELADTPPRQPPKPLNREAEMAALGFGPRKADEPPVVQPPPPVQPPQPEPPAAAAKPGGPPDIDKLLRMLVKMKASDLHLSSRQRPAFRLHGDVHDFADAAVLTPDRVRSLVYPIMPPHNVAQFESTWDTDFAYEIEGLSRFRVNVFMDRLGIGAVFRTIPVEVVTVEDLGLSKEMIDLCYLSKGLVLVTGPTGSGKSTTLCALVDFINRVRKDHIITIEDPIEFVHGRKNCLINQREVHVHTKSFANALRAALREDPDIVLVGEMRDLETIAIAIETAETGHLVFGTLHTTTAASTVDRVIDQFPGERQPQIRAMLSSSLKGVIAQTLCKRADGKGRVAAMEVLLVNAAISNLIREGKIYQIPSIMQTARGTGMIMLNEALFKHVVAGTVTPEEGYIKSVDKSGYLTLLKQSSIPLDLSHQNIEFV